MFTGIVEEVGTLASIRLMGASAELRIRAQTVLQATRPGDSIAVNGVCLTVTTLAANSFSADVMPETLRRSNLGSLRPGNPVDLERAMAANGRFGGHIVSGHIDGLGTITQRRQEGNAIWLRIQPPDQILNLIVEKGSIAIDGVSLTVAAVSENDFQVSLIPTTAANTILVRKGIGDAVNLENDIVGKYVQKLLGPKQKESAETTASANGITLDFLRQNGF